jgi:hypothetical protein
MRRRPLLRLIAATLLLLAAVGGALAALVRYEPEFYRANAVPDGPRRKTEARAFHDHLQYMINAREEAVWGVEFTQEMVNSYLQDESANEFLPFDPPDGVSAPRVALDTDRLRFGFRYGSGWWSTVVSVDLKVWLVGTEPNVIALELCGFSAGALPLGTHTLLEFVSEKVEDLKLNIKVSPYRYDGHPVLLLYYQHDQPRPTLRIQRLECLPGQLAFTARNSTDAPSPAGPPAAH